MKILSVSSDPGGARALSPVLHFLKNEGHNIVTYAYREAIEILGEENLNPQCLSEKVGKDDIKKILLDENPEVCAFGTSMNGLDLEKIFVGTGRELTIPTLSLLDYWSNYSARFSTNIFSHLDALPDIITVMDSVAYSEMKALGFPTSRIRVTGQPALDELFTLGGQEEARHITRNALGIDDTTLLIAFASQPLEDLKTWGSYDYGYTENTVLYLLQEAISRMEEMTAKTIQLWIRPHPRETLEKFTAWRENGTIVSSNFNRNETVAAADLVVGMNSFFLLEAALLGGKTLSLQPGLKGADPLPLARLGLGTTCYDEKEVIDALASTLEHDEPSAIHTKGLQHQYGQGTINVVQQINNLVKSRYS